MRRTGNSSRRLRNNNNNCDISTSGRSVLPGQRQPIRFGPLGLERKNAHRVKHFFAFILFSTFLHGRRIRSIFDEASQQIKRWKTVVRGMTCITYVRRVRLEDIRSATFDFEIHGNSKA